MYRISSPFLVLYVSLALLSLFLLLAHDLCSRGSSSYAKQPEHPEINNPVMSGER